MFLSSSLLVFPSAAGDPEPHAGWARCLPCFPALRWEECGADFLGPCPWLPGTLLQRGKPAGRVTVRGKQRCRHSWEPALAFWYCVHPRSTAVNCDKTTESGRFNPNYHVLCYFAQCFQYPPSFYPFPSTAHRSLAAIRSHAAFIPKALTGK